MAQPIEQLGEVKIEVTQESLKRNRISQRNAQVTTVLLHPGFQCVTLAINHTTPQLLVGHDPRVGHGTHGADPVAPGHIDITRADEVARKLPLQYFKHGLLNSLGETPTRTKVSQIETSQLLRRIGVAQCLKLAT